MSNCVLTNHFLPFTNLYFDKKREKKNIVLVKNKIKRLTSPLGFPQGDVPLANLKNLDKNLDKRNQTKCNVVYDERCTCYEWFYRA